MVVSPLSMSKRESRDAAVAELLRTEAIYVADMKVCQKSVLFMALYLSEG